MKDNVLPILALVLIMAVSGFLSAFTLYPQSIRLDEAQSIWFSTKPLLALLHLVSQDVTVPLYPVLLHFWMQLFGSNIVVARTLSLLLYLLTLPFLYLLAKNSSTTKVALATVALFSLSPFLIWYSAETRMYTLFTLMATANSYYFLKLYNSSGQKGQFGYFLTTLLGFYSHYFFIFLVVTQIVFIGVDLAQKMQKIKEGYSFWERLSKEKTFPLKFVGLLGMATLFFLPWVTYFLLMGAASNTQPLIPPPTSYNIIQTFVLFLFGFQSQSLQSFLVSLWPLSVVLLFFVFTQKKHLPAKNASYFLLATFLPIALVFAASFIKPIFLSRYLILITPSLFFMVAWMILNYSKKLYLPLLAMISAFSIGLIIYQNFSPNTPVREDYEGVSAYLEQKAAPEDIIAVSAPFTIYPLEYTYNGHSRIATIPDWDQYSQGPIPQFSLQQLQNQMQAYQKRYKNIFVVLSYDQGYQKQIQNYLDTHYQLLEAKNFSPGLQSREYKLRYD